MKLLAGRSNSNTIPRYVVVNQNDSDIIGIACWFYIKVKRDGAKCACSSMIFEMRSIGQFHMQGMIPFTNFY